MKFPKQAVLILSAIGGVAQVLNYLVIPASSQLHAVIAVGIYFLIAAGLPPLTGPAFKAVFHLPAWANYLINAALGAVLVALGVVHMTSAVHLVLASVITVLSALGFQASVQPVAVAKLR